MTRESYNKLKGAIGSTQRERTLNTIKNEFANVNESLSNKQVTINGEPFDLTILSSTTKNKKNICSHVHMLHVGDLIEYNLTKWLVLSADVDNEVYSSGTMQQCNYVLRWLNANSDIIESDCIVLNASQYNSGEFTNKTVTISNNQLMIYLPLNEESVKIKNGMRFFIDNDTVNPKVYRVTRVDTVSMTFDGVGCVSLIVTETQFNADTDNVDEFVCGHRQQEDVGSDEIEITYYGETQVVCGGVAKYFTSNIPVAFSITPISSDIVLETISDTKCKVSCKNNTNLIGNTYKLTATSNGVTTELYIDIV